MAREVGGERGVVAFAATNTVGGVAGAREAWSGGAVAPPPARVRRARWGFLVLAWAFAGCVAVQVFLAGMAVFVDSSRWAWHRSFIHVFEVLPLLMLPLAFLARAPAAIRWLTGALFALIFLQYITANSGGVPAAFHPLGGFAIFWIAIQLGGRAWRALREGARGASSR